MIKYVFIFCFFLFDGVTFALQAQSSNILENIIYEHQSSFGQIFKTPEKYEVQIIYTQIDRDKKNRPHFKSYPYRLDARQYFYPASTVKMPLSFLALEKINHLQKKGINITKETPYRSDSLRFKQMALASDTSSFNNLPNIAHDIKRIFMVSDNYAYNNLFDFLGRAYINNELHAKNYKDARILHRFSLAGIDNAYTRPFSFYNEKGNIYVQNELFDANNYPNVLNNTLKGKAYLDAQDKLINEPFDFGSKNAISLANLEGILKAVLFPEVTPQSERFDLSAEDYAFLYKYMSMLPRESKKPSYPLPEYYDGYCKFLMYGDKKEATIPSNIRIFNKVGDAYGTLTDVAYIVDFDKKIEFLLSATIYCNEDGIFNDDKYDYEKIGYPFMGNLGRIVYDYELKRKRKRSPNLNKFKESIKN